MWDDQAQETQNISNLLYEDVLQKNKVYTMLLCLKY